MKWDRRKSKNKPYLLNEYIRPTKEAIEKTEEMKYNNNELKVFVDSSELSHQGVFGFGACYVGQSEVIVKSRKYYNWEIRGKNSYAELKAVVFSLTQLENVLKDRLECPNEINIYSDVPLIRHYIDGDLEDKDKQIQEFAKEIHLLKEEFEKCFPGVEMRINYMEREFKKYNPYYKAAHNAARKILNLKEE